MSATLSHDTDFLLQALRVGKECGLSAFTQAIVLAHLSQKDDGDYPTRIADAAGVTCACITGVLDVLERLRFVEREKADDDRRTRRVRITDAGLETLARMLP